MNVQHWSIMILQSSFLTTAPLRGTHFQDSTGPWLDEMYFFFFTGMRNVHYNAELFCTWRPMLLLAEHWWIPSSDEINLQQFMSSLLHRHTKAVTPLQHNFPVIYLTLQRMHSALQWSQQITRTMNSGVPGRHKTKNYENVKY